MSNTTLVPGINWIAYKLDGGVYKPYACARSGNLSVTMDFLETTTTGSGNAKTKKPTVYGFSAQIDGLISINNSGNITASDLLQSMLAKEKMYWRFMQTSQGGDVVRKEAYFYISGYTDTGAFDGIATFQVTLEGTGALTLIFTPPSPTTGDVKRYPAAGDTAPYTPGSLVWSTGLTGKTPLNIVKDGRGQSDILLSGTPVGNEVLYDSATGDITFAVPFDYGETQPYMEYND